MVEESAMQNNTGDNGDTESEATKQLRYFLSENPIRDVEPLNWWDDNKQRFCALYNVAQNYLSCPAASVASESLFSVTGNIDSNKRRRLLTDRIEQLSFIKWNSQV